MENAMFCFQCQETRMNEGCNLQGMCGKKADLANTMDQLIAELKRISLIVESKGGAPSKEIGRFIIRSMFMTITNANFDEKRLQDQMAEARKLADSMDKNAPHPKVGVLSETHEDIRSLKELLIYGMKGVCAYAEHAYILGYEDDAIYSFLVKGLAATTKSLSADELTALVLECGNIAVTTMALLDKANSSTYGNPEISKVKTGVGTRPGILVSGHDLRDMKDLLEQTAGQGIDIYTHSEMLPANYYPELKKYSHLHGNYGSSWFHQNHDFEKFNGPILMTTNCIIPIRKENTYLPRLFTTGMAGYPGAVHIPDRIGENPKDFSQIIELAKKCQPPQLIDDMELVGGFAHAQVISIADKVVDAIKAGKIKRFIVMAGCDGRQAKREYFTNAAEALPKDTVILTAGCAKYRYNKLGLGDIDGIPRVLDAGQCNDSYSLAVIALKLKEVFGLDDPNKLPLSFDIAWYEQKAVAVLLALLALGFKNIRLGPTLPAFVSPGVLSVLVKTFDLKPTGEVENDVANMMNGL